MTALIEWSRFHTDLDSSSGFVNLGTRCCAFLVPRLQDRFGYETRPPIECACAAPYLCGGPSPHIILTVSDRSQASLILGAVAVAVILEMVYGDTGCPCFQSLALEIVRVKNH